MTGVLRRGEEVDTDTRGGDSPEATWRRQRTGGREGPPLQSLGDAGPAHTLTLCVRVCT